VCSAANSGRHDVICKGGKVEQRRNSSLISLKHPGKSTEGAGPFDSQRRQEPVYDETEPRPGFGQHRSGISSSTRRVSFDPLRIAFHMGTPFCPECNPLSCWSLDGRVGCRKGGTAGPSASGILSPAPSSSAPMQALPFRRLLLAGPRPPQCWILDDGAQALDPSRAADSGRGWR